MLLGPLLTCIGYRESITRGSGQQYLKGVKNFPKAELEQVLDHLLRIVNILSYDLGCWSREEFVNLLERLVPRLGHEEDLVKPANDSDTAVEPEG